MITELFRKTAVEFGEEPAIIDGERRMSYGELTGQVTRARGWLRAALQPAFEAAQRPVIALCLKNSWQFVASYFAILEAGGIVLPANPSWRAAELRQIALRLGIQGVVTCEELRGEWDKIAGELPSGSILSWETVPESSVAGESNLENVPAEARDAEDPLVYLLTSGSTGAPKVVPRSVRSLRFNATCVADALQITAGSRWLCATPFHHSWGLHTAMLLPLLRGGTLVILTQFHAARCVELIRRERVNALTASPFAYGVMADLAFDPAALATLDSCFWAGARLKADIGQIWSDRHGIQLRAWYGISETSGISCDPAGAAAGDRIEGCVGTPIPGVEAGVFDAAGNRLGVNQTGEVGIRSDGVMTGYVDGEAENRNAFYGAFFRTGDLGRLDDSGKLYLSGRSRLVLNIAGVKVDPVEVELAVEKLDGVAACRVDSLPGGAAGESIRARVVLREGRELSRREVIEHCRLHLAEYKLPRVIEFADAPTGAGKLPR